MLNDFFSLYILVAPSAVGKSVLLNKITEEGLWVKIPKYSTRDTRGNSDDVVKIDDYSLSNLHEEERLKVRVQRISEINKLCGENNGVVYYKNGNIYGIKIIDVLDALQHNNVAVIISDFNVIKLLKNDSRLKDRIKVLYIASTIDERELLKRYKSRETISFDTDSESKKRAIKNIHSFSSVLESATRLSYMDRIEEVMPLLNEEWNTILPYFETIKTRGANISKLYYQYIENISLIDYTILNFYDLEYMYSQVRNIIKNNVPLLRVQYPPVFMVCAAPSSGKATLMEIVGDLGEINGNIKITKKYAKRDARTTDGRDGMIAIGKNGDFIKYISNVDNIWEWDFHKDNISVHGISYAVNKAEIDININNNISQIFISNMEQIDKAREFYPNNLVVLYLHAAHETETRKHIIEKCKEDILKEIQFEFNYSNEETLEKFQNEHHQKRFKATIESKLCEIKKVHYDFLLHNYKINHVLLNTGTREDLVSQMTNIIDYYLREYKGKPVVVDEAN